MIDMIFYRLALFCEFFSIFTIILFMAATVDCLLLLENFVVVHLVFYVFVRCCFGIFDFYGDFWDL